MSLAAKGDNSIKQSTTKFPRSSSMKQDTLELAGRRREIVHLACYDEMTTSDDRKPWDHQLSLDPRSFRQSTKVRIG